MFLVIFHRVLHKIVHFCASGDVADFASWVLRTTTTCSSSATVAPRQPVPRLRFVFVQQLVPLVWVCRMASWNKDRTLWPTRREKLKLAQARKFQPRTVHFERGHNTVHHEIGYELHWSAQFLCVNQTLSLFVFTESLSRRSTNDFYVEPS